MHKICLQSVVADVEVDSAVFIEVGKRQYERHSVRGLHAPCLRYRLKATGTGIAPDVTAFRRVGRSGHATGAETIVFAILFGIGSEDHIIQDHQVEPLIAVEINKSGAGTPLPVV